MKCLFISGNGLGDVISTTIPLARYVSKTAKIHCLTHNMNSYNIMRNMDCFENCSHTHDVEFSLRDDCKIRSKMKVILSLFNCYNSVYIINANQHKYFCKEFNSIAASKIASRLFGERKYRPIQILENYGITGEPNLKLDLKLYQEFFVDFNCGSRSILVNGCSCTVNRSYNQMQDVVLILKSKGFDVRLMDFSLDIRTNLHLIHQVTAILTVDTSTLWLAKALGKKPFVFFPYALPAYKNLGNPEEMLGSISIVSNKFSNVSEINSSDISHHFLHKLINFL